MLQKPLPTQTWTSHLKEEGITNPLAPRGTVAVRRTGMQAHVARMR
jgi:hypothetical protein